jgi:hypothetical protein
MFRLQLLLNRNLALVQSAELVDFVLIFSSNLNLVACSGGFILLGELGSISQHVMDQGEGRYTILLWIASAMLMCRQGSILLPLIL